MAKTREMNEINLSEYQEGMPCHRYILRNLRTEMDALSFVKTFVNTMTHVKMSDSQIEACIYLFSTHLPPGSPLKGFMFENWPNLIDGMSLVDCIRMDSSVATYKKCMQFYKNQSFKTDACKICPLHRKYCNSKKDIESLVLRYALESKDNFDYVHSMGVMPIHFHTLVDVLEHVTTALLPGIYSFYSDLFKALEQEYIADAHFANADKTIPCKEIEKFISNKLLNGAIPTSFVSSPTFINRVIIVLWDSVMESPLKTKDEIHPIICSLLSADIEKNVVSNTGIAKKSNLGKESISDYYSHGVPKDRNTASEQMVDAGRYEHISMSSILKDVVVPEKKDAEVDMFSSFSSFMELDENSRYTSNSASEGVQLSSPVDEYSEPKVEEVDLLNLFDMPLEEIIRNEEDVCKDNPEPHLAASIFDMNIIGEETPSEEICAEYSFKKSFHTTESGEIELHELSAPAYDKEFFEEDGSMISIPSISFQELSHFAICLDNAESRLLTIFESHVLKDGRLCIELVKTPKGYRYFLIYSPRLHAYFYTNMSDKRVYELLKYMLSFPSIDKYCYFPFALAASLMKFEIYPRAFVSLFCLTCINMPGHTLNMEQALEMLGAAKAIGGVTVEPEGDIESLPILYMHAYPNVYRRISNSFKRSGLYADYLERNQFDMILSRFYYQDLYEKENRSLLMMPNAGRYLFSDIICREYRVDGKCYTYRFSRCYAPNRLLRKVILAMDNKGYFKKYHIMITALSAISFTLFIASNECERLRTLIHVTLLDILMDDEYRDVEYELIEIKE